VSDAVEVLASAQPEAPAVPAAVSAALRLFEAEAARLGWQPWGERVPASLLAEGSRRRGCASGA